MSNETISQGLRLVNKTDSIKKIGKPSFWLPKRIANVCTYIAGVQEIDERQGRILLSPALEVYPKGLSFFFVLLKGDNRIAIHDNQLEKITIEKGAEIDRQSKSVVGRAVLGGLLLGPLGAVVGGVSGVKDKITKEEDVLMFTINIEGVESVILFNIQKGKTNKVYSFFKAHFPRITNVQ